MNQILVSEKLYVTPELRRKKRLFKIEFFLSVFLVCILSSYYIYAEYDRNKSEEVSRVILADMGRNAATNEDTTVKEVTQENDVMIIVVENDINLLAATNNATTNTNSITNETVQQVNDDDRPILTQERVQETIQETREESIGIQNRYKYEAVLTIPKIGITYPVLSDTSDDLLEVSVNKYWGPQPNEVGNYCIVGHNYRNGKMFGRLSYLVNGDVIELKDLSGRTLKYKVYNRYVVKPTDTKCTSQLTNGKKELTLITCTNYGTERLVIKCRAI